MNDDYSRKLEKIHSLCSSIHCISESQMIEIMDEFATLLIENRKLKSELLFYADKGNVLDQGERARNILGMNDGNT